MMSGKIQQHRKIERMFYLERGESDANIAERNVKAVDRAP